MRDNLGRTTYAEKIAAEILERYEAEKKAFEKGEKRERENIIFAVSGKWGEGKTSLLDLLEKPLKKKDFKVIRFNPWKYSQEDITLKRAFLRTIKRELNSAVDLDDMYYDRTKTVIDWKNINWLSVIKWISITLFILLIQI